MISVIVPVYKNKELFLNNLKNNLKYLSNCEIIIVNDDPSLSLNNDLKNHNNITLVENDKNLGFGSSINEGVKKTHNQYLMLLNSDVRLSDRSFEKGVEDLKKDKLLFAVSFAQIEKNNITVGKNKIYWKCGFFYHGRNNVSGKGYNAWCEGGACIIDKEKFLDIGGFDNLYAPFYWEDVDLSYRAWKRGYIIIFNPNIRVYHEHESTIRKYFNQEKINEIAFRNQLIFIWKNILDNALIFQHIIFIAPIIIKALFKRNTAFLKGFFSAVSKIGLILKERNQEKNKYIKTDRTVLNYFH